MTNSVDPDQTAPTGEVCSGSTLFASTLDSSVMLGNYLQQTTSADDIFRCVFFLALYRLTSTNQCIHNDPVSSHNCTFKIRLSSVKICSQHKKSQPRLRPRLIIQCSHIQSMDIDDG